MDYTYCTELLIELRNCSTVPTGLFSVNSSSHLLKLVMSADISEDQGIRTFPSGVFQGLRNVLVLQLLKALNC